MKTKDVRFTALIKYVNKTLMTIANIGDDIYERDNLDDINKSLEEFATEVVKQAEEILDKYKDNSPATTDKSANQDKDNNQSTNNSDKDIEDIMSFIKGIG
jgi:uncharacterized membrane protein YukC